MKPGPDETLSYLSGDFRIFQRRDGHRWSLDDLLTAWVARRIGSRSGADAAADQMPAVVLDLGCGIGSVLMMVAWAFPGASCLGLEAQSLSVDLARRSLAYNGLEERVQVIQLDLRTYELEPEQPPFDLITGTPPYLPFREGIVSSGVQKGPCRFEFRGGIEAYCEAASRLLAPRGRFVVCEGATQLERVERAATQAGLEILERLEVSGREGKPALFWVFVMGRNDTEARSTRPSSREQALVVRDRRGQWTPHFRRVREDMGLPPPLEDAFFRAPDDGP